MDLRIIPDVVQDQVIYRLRESDTVQEAARRMIEHDVSALVVVGADERLIGIVTERDIARRVAAPNLDSGATPLGEVMTRDPVTADPSDLAHEALQRMLERGIRHLPVVEEGRVVGVVSMRTLQRSIAGMTSRLAL